MSQKSDWEIAKGTNRPAEDDGEIDPAKRACREREKKIKKKFDVGGGGCSALLLGTAAVLACTA